MNTEITLLSDDQLDAIAGGEVISQSVSLLVSLARITAGAVNSELQHLSNAAGLSSFNNNYQTMQFVTGRK